MVSFDLIKSLNTHFMRPWVPSDDLIWPYKINNKLIYDKLLTLHPCLVYSSTGLKYLISLGSKNMWRTTDFFLWHLRG